MLNKAFLLLRDFEFTADPIADSSWVLLTSLTLPDESPTPTSIPLNDISQNDFANSSFSDINAFVRSHEAKFKALALTTSNWLIIDQKGLDTSTCLVVEQVYDSEYTNEEGRMTDDFRAARLPYTEAWSMYCNLDIANMDFEDWVDEEAGVQRDGAYLWVGPFPGDDDKTSADTEVKREATLKALRDLGHVD